ncbi:MAG: GxxExxY protein [Planctomycetaceae bacterium]
MTFKHENLGGDLSGQLIAAAIAVHREFGPGVDEPDYERALSLELGARGIEHECQVGLPLVYKDTKLDCGYRIDLIVARHLLVELKAVDKMHPVHEAQLITYLRLSGIKLGLLINFSEMLLRDGIMRRANSHAPSPRHRIKVAIDTTFDPLSHEVIDAALEVQHVLGSGLLRSAYEAALAYELRLRGMKVAQRLPVNLVDREQLIPSEKEIPMVVAGQLMIACVCAKVVEPIHLARQRSLLKAAKVDTGLCFNFHAESMATEIKRISSSYKPI